MALSRSPDPHLHRLAESLSAPWLAGQRWFRGKSRSVDRVELSDAAQLPGTDVWLLVLTATDTDGVASSYLVPGVIEESGFREPRDGEGVWRSMVDLIASGGELRGARGNFAFEPMAALAQLLAGGAVAERRVQGEQSNTSVILGDRLILKIYRHLKPGANPEIEVTAFLNTVAFADAPVLCGSAIYRPDGGESCAAGMLQQLVPSEGDAWQWVLDCLSGPTDGQAAALAGIAQIGNLTARVHAALASRPELASFPSRPASNTELAAWHSSAARQLEGALAVVDGEARQRLQASAPGIRDRLGAIAAAEGTRATRIHGDYHLGQLLRTSTGFTVIDFEGEPARSLAERRAPASPLRDVAGMLRSLDYAAHVAHRDGAGPPPDSWLPDARAALLSGYGGLTVAQEGLCDAFEIEKACYEIRYEADNRPDWLWLPLAALERLAI
ncbi:MAG: phosphotransferase [Chloroflexota bacterium]|nr:phosphotransferase [Chloroflexota bacterium]